MGCALIKNVTSGDDSNVHDLSTGSISCCCAMMSWLMAPRSTGWQAMVGKAVAPSLSVMEVLYVLSVEVAGGHG